MIVGDRVELPTPGSELETMCDNARRVARMCELIGFGSPDVQAIGRELEAGLLDEPYTPDGAWYLPEEDL